MSSSAVYITAMIIEVGINRYAKPTPMSLLISSGHIQPQQQNLVSDVCSPTSECLERFANAQVQRGNHFRLLTATIIQ